MCNKTRLKQYHSDAQSHPWHKLHLHHLQIKFANFSKWAESKKHGLPWGENFRWALTLSFSFCLFSFNFFLFGIVQFKDKTSLFSHSLELQNSSFFLELCYSKTSPACTRIHRFFSWILQLQWQNKCCETHEDIISSMTEFAFGSTRMCLWAQTGSKHLVRRHILVPCIWLAFLFAFHSWGQLLVCLMYVVLT